MTPIARAAEYYLSGNPENLGAFYWDVDQHVMHGYVYSTPEYFMLLRPVDRYATESRISDPSYVFTPESCNCWFVMMMAGDLRRCFVNQPYYLPFCGYAYKDRLRFYKTDTIKLRVERSWGHQ